MLLLPRVECRIGIHLRLPQPPTWVEGAGQWCDNLRTRNPARDDFTDPPKGLVIDPHWDSTLEPNFRIQLRLCCDGVAGRLRPGGSAGLCLESRWASQETRGDNGGTSAQRLHGNKRSPGQRGVSRDGGCVRMDSGGRVLTCASHDIIVASPQRNTMHEACWRPGQTLNGFFFC